MQLVEQLVEQLGDDESIRATCDLDVYLYMQWSMLQWGKFHCWQW